MITDSFLKTLKAYKAYQNWGEFHQLRVQHILGNIPLLGSKYHFGDYAVNGFSSTMNKTSSALTEKPHFVNDGAASRHISFMNDKNENYFLLLGGEKAFDKLTAKQLKALKIKTDIQKV
jgi:hypothetical protein